MDLVSGKVTPQLKFLAAKILLGRLIASVQGDPSPGNVKKSIDQLHDLLDKNAHMPSVQADIKTIFG
jgi:hypothetical protein